MVKTVRGKVTLWCILIIGTLNIILSIFIYNTISSNLEDTIAENMQNIKYMAKNTAISSFDLNTPITNNSINDDLLNSSKGLVDNLYNYYGNYIKIVINDDITFYRGNLLFPDGIDSILLESKNKKSLLKLTKTNGYYIATYNYPLYLDENYLGNLVIQKDYTTEYKENYSVLFNILIGQAILLLVLILILWFIIGNLTAPIKNLSEAIDLFGKGNNIDDIKVAGDDEISVLTENFNMMKNQINNQIEEIKLEQKKSREFFNNATHEIKTPITAISGYAQVLLEEDIVNMDEDFRDRALIRMVKESEKLNTLAKNILDISKGTTITVKEAETFDLGQLLYSKINDMQIRLIKSNINISSTIENIYLELIKDDLSTIISNLLDNAIKYSAGNTIYTSLCKLDNEVELRISNKIYDLPESIKDKLLDPFIKHTSDEVLQREGITSSGLGLYLCKQLANNNNGRLDYIVESNTIIFILKLQL